MTETDHINKVYGHGLPFEKKLGENLKSLIDRVHKKKASLMIIDGGVGEGKTTLGVEVADYINEQHDLQKIKYSQQLAMGGVDFTKKMRVCHGEKLPAIVYDEAGDFNKRGALTRFNAMLNRTFETFRAFKIVVILCLPSFYVLDQDLFDKNIPRLLVHCHSRKPNYGQLSGYSLYRMCYIREKMKKLVVKAFAYQIVHPNFRGCFLDLPKARCNELDNLTIKGKLDVLKKAEIKLDGLIDYNTLATKLSRSVSNVRKLIAICKIEPARVIGQTKYFKEEIVNHLADYIEEKGGMYKEAGESRHSPRSGRYEKRNHRGKR